MGMKDILGKLIGDKALVLELDLARGVLVAKPSNPLQAIQLLNSPSLSALRAHLAEAATDDRVKGLIVHACPSATPLAVTEEIGQLVEEFGKFKPTMAWAESFGELVQGLSAYHVATAAQQIWVQPTGMLSIEGVEVSILLLKGLLNKVGIEPQFEQRKEYKSAAEQYSADQVSEANREMTTRLGQSLVDEIVASVARRRKLSVEQVWDAVNASPITPERALELGLIDHIGYRDEAYDAVLKEWDADAEDLLFVHRYTNKAAMAKKLRLNQPKVAVVSLRGPIVTGRGKPQGMGGEQAGADVVDEHLRAALRDDDVKAVVFEVNSPGGSAVASDFIRRSVIRLKDAGKPVVAHMGALAASGGYYVSMPATEIVAQASTLTGSIGVLAGKMVTNGLYDKLGLIREAIPIGAAADFFSDAHEFTEDHLRRLNDWLDRVYLDFTTAAAHDRGMEYEELERLARGRVWTGADALERGLVDHIGGQRLAVERACELAGLKVDDVKLAQVGASGMFAALKPANSSESTAAEVRIPDAESLLTGVAAKLGIHATGALSMPVTLRVR